MSVKDQLTKEIESQIEALGEMQAGTEEYEKTVTGVTKLLDKYNEMDRNEFDYWEKRESREQEADLKVKQMDEDRKDRNVKNCLTAVSIFGGFAVTIWGTLKSLKFEETGSVTTIMGRGFINKLLPKK